MSNFEDYNTKIEVIKTITDDQIKIPSSIPVDNYIQETKPMNWLRCMRHQPGKGMILMLSKKSAIRLIPIKRSHGHDS